MLIKTHESLIDVIQVVAVVYKGLKRDHAARLHMHLEPNMVVIDNVGNKVAVTFEPEFDYVRVTMFKIIGDRRVFVDSSNFSLNQQRSEIEHYLVAALGI